KLVAGAPQALVTGVKARRYGLPLARRVGVDITSPDPTDQFYALAFYYPFAIGLVVHAHLSKVASIDDLVDRAVAIRNGPLTVVEPGAAARSEPIEAFALRTIDRLAGEVIAKPSP